MDELLDSNVPLVDKDSGCSAVILPACKATTSTSSSASASTAASTLAPLSVVHYKSSNISPATSTTEATTATTASTAILASAADPLPASQQGSSTGTSSSEPVPLLNQLQSLPLQKPNDLKQCNALCGWVQRGPRFITNEISMDYVCGRKWDTWRRRWELQFQFNPDSLSKLGRVESRRKKRAWERALIKSQRLPVHSNQFRTLQPVP